MIGKVEKEEKWKPEKLFLNGSVFHQTDQKHVFSPDGETILKDFITQRLWVEASATRDPLGRGREQGGGREQGRGREETEMSSHKWIQPQVNNWSPLPAPSPGPLHAGILL